MHTAQCDTSEAATRRALVKTFLCIFRSNRTQETDDALGDPSEASKRKSRPCRSGIKEDKGAAEGEDFELVRSKVLF